MTDQVWVVTVFGEMRRVIEVFRDQAGPDSAQEFALEHVNYLRREVGLPDEENPYAWQKALGEWRRAKALELHDSAEEPLSLEDNMWIEVWGCEIRGPREHY
jgi:hypothetical protein